MLVQAVKRNNEWIIPDIPEFHAQNEDHILLDVHVADAREKPSNTEEDQPWTDEYLEKNWKRIVSKSLASLPEDYEKSDEYFEARANYLMEKYK